MPIKYSTYDSSSGNDFSLTTVTGVSGVFTNQVSGNTYKTTSGVVVISGSGEVRPYGIFSFPRTSGGSGAFLIATTGGETEWSFANTSNVQLFNSNGTWNKPGGISVVYVELVGGGGGGNSGGKGTITNGGAGGAGGAFLFQVFSATTISDVVTVTVGAGGSGGPSQTTGNSSGLYGTVGGESSFGSYLKSSTTQSGTSAVIAQTGSLRGVLNITTTVGGGQTIAGTTSLYAGAGGGGGTTVTTPGRGGFARWLSTVGTGAASGTNAVSGEGGGGGGGGFVAGASGVRGGNGAYPGGGGGGGGTSTGGFNSGAGGNGAPGFVRVICW